MSVPKTCPPCSKALDALGLANPGFDTTADITTCPGTDTCNLAISSSYGITRALERMMHDEFPDLVFNDDIKIKISGCMNGCGQHSVANIGYHGSSLKNGAYVLPALQVLLGGGFNGKGEGLIADKVIKIPAKRGPDSLRLLLRDFEANAFDGEYYSDYYARQGKNYFYQLLKPLADLKTLVDSDYIDWDHTEQYVTEVGVGECASVLIDLVATTLTEAGEKLGWAQEALADSRWADALYHAYNVFITGARAALMSRDIPTNTQHGIVNDFDKTFVPVRRRRTAFPRRPKATLKHWYSASISRSPPKPLPASLLAQADTFLQAIQAYRARQIEQEGTPELQELSQAQDT